MAEADRSDTGTGGAAPVDAGVVDPEQIDDWSGLYAWARRQVGEAREARWMVEEASGESWAEMTGTRAPVVAKARGRLVEMVERRRRGEPLQYVLGRWGFRTLELMVDRRVLIPRPETESVVDEALRELDRVPSVSHRKRLAVDLGTGSGAIALSLAAERIGVEVWATDLSPAALDVTRANLAGMGGFAATRVRIAQGHWWAALPPDLRGKVDLVVSNPPYISVDEMEHLDPVVTQWEPRTALEAGPSGLEAVRHILADAPQWLADGGVAVIEMAPHQAEGVRRLAREVGFTSVEVRRDLTGRDRTLVARL